MLQLALLSQVKLHKGGWCGEKLSCCSESSLFCFSALSELLGDLVYNITTARIYRTVQELVFESVLKQELAFFDSRKPGNPRAYLYNPFTLPPAHLQDNLFYRRLLVMNWLERRTEMVFAVSKDGKTWWRILASVGELVSHITTSTNTMSETLSQEMSYLMWYVSRFAFLLFFMLTQSWKMLLLTWMGLPICWVIAKFTGTFQEVELFHTFPIL